MKIRIPVLILLAASLALDIALARDGEDAFAPRTFALAVDSPPEIPMPEAPRIEAIPTGTAATQAMEAAPAPSPMDESARTTAIVGLFVAVAENRPEAIASLLAAGIDADSQLPQPAPEELVERYRGTELEYIVRVMRGLTPLMLAAAAGHREAAAVLLGHGAKPGAKSKPHGTTPIWLAGHFGHIELLQMLLGVQPDSVAARTCIQIDLSGQMAVLVRDGMPETAVPISSGRRKFPTPRGEFVITDKHRQWKSTLYHASMPFFMRLSSRDFGLHAGHLPGYPASHGCIRLQRKDAERLFKEVPVGARVVIK